MVFIADNLVELGIIKILLTKFWGKAQELRESA